MGGAASSSKFGHLYLKPDKDFYYAGENVTGTIYISMVQNYPGRTVYLKVIGREYTHWSEQKSYTTTSNGKTQTHHYTVYYTGDRLMLHHKFPVYTFPQSWVPQGQYGIPIQFQLPAFIPGSFGYGRGNVSANISYTIEAEIESIDKGISNMVYSQPITVRELIKEQIQSLRGEMTINVKTWCCINQGTTFVRAYFDKNAYAPGETANVICEIDNTKCDLDMNNVEFVLINRMHFTANCGTSHNIVEEVTKMTQPGIKAKQLAAGDTRRIFSMVLQTTKTGTQLQPSTQGQLISNKYFLKIRADPNGCTCCSDKPFVEVPINIYAPQHIIPQVEIPQGWNPVTMPVANLMITDAYLFQSQEPTGNVAPPPPPQGNFAPGQMPPQPNYMNQPPNQTPNYAPGPPPMFTTAPPPPGIYVKN